MGATKLAVFHLGPVQEFIMTARRNRDFWFGSWMLSELAKAAARQIVEVNGGNMDCLVFPSPSSLEDVESEEFNAPNRIVAFLKGDPETVAESVRQAVLRRLHELRDEAYSDIKGDFRREVAREQVDDLIEFYWAAASIRDEDEYVSVRRLVEWLLSSRKMTRDFHPVSWGSNASKCSLDGIRESVIPDVDCVRKDKLRLEVAEALRRDYDVRPGEHLCGVCLLKRHGMRTRQVQFLSTSHIAAIPLLDRLKEQDAPLVQAYVEELKALGVSENELATVRPPHPVFGSYDGEILFEERLSEFLPDEKVVPQAKKALRKLLQEVFNVQAPSPYYALLAADGDNMGKIIDAQKTPHGHRELSALQSRFPREVARIMREHHGSLVYSGGDDVLALLPLHTAIKCARVTAEAFRTLLQDFCTEGNGEFLKPTLSVGMVIAHHLAPLSDVLRLAMDAEKAAKSVKDKNALAVTLAKRSGSDRMVKGHWGEIDRRLEWFAYLTQTDALSARAAYQLHGLALEIEEHIRDSATIGGLLRCEVKRILSRKREKRGLREIAGDTLDGLMTEIEKALSDGNEPCQVISQIADEIIIARELAKVSDLASDLRPTRDSYSLGR